MKKCPKSPRAVSGAATRKRSTALRSKTAAANCALAQSFFRLTRQGLTNVVDPYAPAEVEDTKELVAALKTIRMVIQSHNGFSAPLDVRLYVVGRLKEIVHASSAALGAIKNGIVPSSS